MLKFFQQIIAVLLLLSVLFMLFLQFATIHYSLVNRLIILDFLMIIFFTNMLMLLYLLDPNARRKKHANSVECKAED